jgi:hypothetical protein
LDAICWEVVDALEGPGRQAGKVRKRAARPEWCTGTVVRVESQYLLSQNENSASMFKSGQKCALWMLQSSHAIFALVAQVKMSSSCSPLALPAPTWPMKSCGEKGGSCWGSMPGPPLALQVQPGLVTSETWTRLRKRPLRPYS